MNKHMRLAVVVVVLSIVMAGQALAKDATLAGYFEKKAEKLGLMYFHGKISAIDLKANTVTIKKMKDIRTFTCNDSTKYFIVGQKAEGKLSDFKVGDRGRVFYSAKDGTNVVARLWQKGSLADRKEKIAERKEKIDEKKKWKMK